MDIRRTESYDEQIGNRDVCNCAYCQNDVQEIKAAYPDIADYLFSLGIDIENRSKQCPLNQMKRGNSSIFLSNISFGASRMILSKHSSVLSKKHDGFDTKPSCFFYIIG